MDFKRLTKPRFLLVYPVVAALFLVARISERTLRWGIPVVALGELIRIWANGYVGHRKVNWTERSRNDPKIGSLITAGPYAFVRNPLYFGSFLIGAGFCVMVGSAWFGVAALLALALVYRRQIREEEETLRHEYPEEFARYAAAVPGWCPTLTPMRGGNGSWSWRGIDASREWKTAIWTAVLVIVLYFWEEAAQGRARFFRRLAPVHLILLGVAAALVAADLLLELAKRRATRAVGARSLP